MNRFYYSAIRDMKQCEGIIRAESIDSAREKLIQEGYEDITINVLSSSRMDIDNGLEAIPD